MTRNDKNIDFDYCHQDKVTFNETENKVSEYLQVSTVRLELINIVYR